MAHSLQLDEVCVTCVGEWRCMFSFDDVVKVCFFSPAWTNVRAISWHLIDRKRNSCWSRDVFFDADV